MRTARILLLLVFPLALIGIACSSDGPLADAGGGTGSAQPPASQPDATQPPATQPPETQPPATDPPATQPPATDAPTDTTAPTSEEDDGWDWLAVLLSVAVILAVIAVIVAVRARRQDDPEPAAAPEDPAAAQRRQIIGRSQWVHDQLSLELLAGNRTADQLATDRRQIDDIIVACNERVAAGDHEIWGGIGAKLGELSRSLELAGRLGTDGEVDPGVAAEARQVANRQRDELQQLITAARALV